MDFRTELSKWGYNKGNSISVEILIDEVLPSLFPQQERMYSEEEVETIAKDAYTMGRNNILIGVFNKWFEQFKKK
jgi:hypothetical protein